ncbi:hypothetical protein [Flavobacterium sp.]|uniref:hypothetical protein n=1 Tax=Flavobacterium sp. TaxID=239 RepID=UPI0035B04F46
MEKTYENKTFKFISEHLAILIFIPLFFGGVTQVANLYYISPVFVRFFSPTQAISDGIFIMTYMVLSFLWMSFIFIPPDKKLMERRKARAIAEGKINNKAGHTQMPIIGYLIISVFSVWTIYYLISRLYAKPDTENIGISIILIGFLFWLFNSFFIMTVFSIIYRKKEDFLKGNERAAIVSYFVLNTIIAICVLSFVSKLNSNIGNFEELKKITLSKNTTCKVLYYNDQYVFISIKEKNAKTNKITIIKFESILEEDFLFPEKK